MQGLISIDCCSLYVDNLHIPARSALHRSDYELVKNIFSNEASIVAIGLFIQIKL